MSEMLRTNRFSKISLTLFILIFAAIGGYILFTSSAATTMTGASLGICSPSPCTQGTIPGGTNGATNEVSLGTIFNDWANENYEYHYYVPHGLACTGSSDCSAADPNHKPAAVFLSSGSGGYPNNASGTAALTDSGWQHVADANHLIIIVLDWPTNCVSQVINSSGVITTPGTEITCGGWQRPKTTCDMYVGTAPNLVRWNYNIDGAGAGGTVPPGKIICDSSHNNAADESSSVPYVVALVNATVSRFGLDPSRLYFTGASSGGAMTRELMCDSRSSNLFRGYAIISNGTNSTPNGTQGSCPNSANRNFFVQYVSGTNGNQDPYNTGNIPGSCVVGASGVGSDPCTHSQMGFTDSRNWTASYFGCGSPTVTGTAGSLTTNVIYDYQAGCVYGLSPQVEFISVGNGGHTWPCLDAVPQIACAGSSTNPTNGFNTAQTNWAFFAGTTTGISGGGTPAPTVSLSAAPTSITSGSSSTLTWSSTNATACTASGAWSGSKSTSSSQTVSPTTTSTYNMTCSGSGGTSNVSSATVTVTTPPPADTTPPTVSITAPASGATVSGSSVAISVTAADNTGGSGLASISLALDSSGTLGAGSSTSPYNYSWNTTTLGNGTHTLVATAKDKAGNTGTSSVITITVNNTSTPPPDTTPPSVPANLHSTSTTTSSVSLAWNASTDSGTNASGVAGYHIYKSGNLLSSTSLLNYTDSGLSAGTSYSYQVSAYDNAGNQSAKSAAINVSTTSNPPNPPPSPGPSPLAKLGDIDGDGKIDIADLSILLSHYNQSGPNLPGDLNGDGIVDVSDLSILLAHYTG